MAQDEKTPQEKAADKASQAKELTRLYLADSEWQGMDKTVAEIKGAHRADGMWAMKKRAAQIVVNEATPADLELLALAQEKLNPPKDATPAQLPQNAESSTPTPKKKRSRKTTRRVIEATVEASSPVVEGQTT